MLSEISDSLLKSSLRAGCIQKCWKMNPLKPTINLLKPNIMSQLWTITFSTLLEFWSTDYFISVQLGYSMAIHLKLLFVNELFKVGQGDELLW